MTTYVEGLRICPQCGRSAEDHLLTSFSSFGARQRRGPQPPRWSDGVGAEVYYRTVDDLVRCWRCRFVFCEHDAEWREAAKKEPDNAVSGSKPTVPRFLGRQAAANLEPPENSSDQASSLFERMSARASQRDQKERAKEPSSKLGAERTGSAYSDSEILDLLRRMSRARLSEHETAFESVLNAEAPLILMSGDFAPSAEPLLRTKWWWDEGSLQREIAVTADQALADNGSKPQQIDGNLKDNLLRLTQMLDPLQKPLLVGEIYRHLGGFDDALACYGMIPATGPRKLYPPPEEWKVVLEALAACGKSAVVLLPDLVPPAAPLRRRGEDQRQRGPTRTV